MHSVNESNTTPLYFRCHNIAEILLELVLNTNQSINQLLYFSFQYLKNYFKISLLTFSATLPDVEVMVTCGSAAVHHASRNICVPPEFYPTTTVVHSPPTTYSKNCFR